MMDISRGTPVPALTGSTNWNVVLAFAAVTITTQLLWVTFTPITTGAATLLGVSENGIGWLSEVFPLVYVILAIPFGLLTDKWFRSSVVIGTVLTALGGLLRLEDHFDIILVGQLVTSIGQPLILNAINKVAAVYAAPRHQTIAISLCSASLFLGILLAMLSGPILLDAYSLSMVLMVQAAFSVVASIWFLSAILMYPLRSQNAAEASQRTTAQRTEGAAPSGEPGAMGPGARDSGARDSGARDSQLPGSWGMVRDVWSNRHMRTLCYLLFVGFGIFIALTTWLQALLAPKHVSDLAVGIALALMTAAGMIGAAVVPDWAIRKRRGRRMIISSLATSVVASLYILVGLPFWVMTAFLMVAGFLLLADLPIVLTTAELLSKPSEVGTATALLMLFGNAGGIVLALLVQGLIFSTVGAVAVLVVAVFVVIPFAARFPEYHSGTGAS